MGGPANPWQVVLSRALVSITATRVPPAVPRPVLPTPAKMVGPAALSQVTLFCVPVRLATRVLYVPRQPVMPTRVKVLVSVIQLPIIPILAYPLQAQPPPPHPLPCPHLSKR